MRNFVGILALGLLTATLAMSADYKFDLADKAQVGQTQLKPGQYLLTVDGGTAELKDKSGSKIDVKAKVEQTTKKAVSTTYGMSPDGKLLSVTLRGTQTRVVFD